MLHAGRHDKELARAEFDGPLWKVDAKAPLQHQEKIVRVRMRMPAERPLRFDDHDVVAVEGGNGTWRPVVGEPGELVLEVNGGDGGHGGLSQVEERRSFATDDRRVLYACCMHVPSDPLPANWARFTPGVLSGVTRVQAGFKDHVFERHSHATFSLGVTCSGVQMFQCRGERHASLRGHVMLFNPDEPHDGQSGTAEGFTYTIVHLEPHVLDLAGTAGAGVAARRFFRRTVVEDVHLGARVARVIAAMGLAGESLRAETLLARLLHRLLRQHGDPPATTSFASPGGRRMADVRDFIEAHAADDLTVGQLAQLTGLSRAHVADHHPARPRLGRPLTHVQRPTLAEA